MTPAEQFEAPMREAIRQAHKGRWTACPNPTVGAVLLQEGRIVARGYHHRAGQPHAEIECLRDAAAQGISPKGGTMCVTLEPCNHTGRTGPCSHALVEAGIARCVIGMRDPNAIAAGGAGYLRANGIEVIEGVLEQDCRDLAADFVTWTSKKRPFVILKLATTLDGRIATRTGHSQWVTSETSRGAVHALRAGAGRAGGAMLVGGGTFRADDPKLTARLEPAPERQPLACVLTSHLPENPQESFLTRERPSETLFFTTEEAARTEAARRLADCGCTVAPLPAAEGGLSLSAMFPLLWERGCHYLICEGGGRLGLSLLSQHCCDLLSLYVAPKILGDNSARPLFDGLTPRTMQEALNLRILSTGRSGEDMHILLAPKNGNGE